MACIAFTACAYAHSVVYFTGIYIALSIHIYDQSQVIIQQPELKKPNAPCTVSGGYALLNDNNNVEWHVKAEQEAELELKLVYTVEHPAQDAVEGLPK